MSDQHPEPARLTEPASPAATMPPKASPLPPRKARNGWAASLALLLAVLALIAVTFGGWRLWQLEQGDHAGSTALVQLRQRVEALDAAQSRTHAQRDRMQQALRAQMSTAAQDDRDLSAQLNSLSERTRHLEDAVARLSTSSLSAHDNLALDETDALLRMAAERYALFHDGNSALKAYALAAQTLATINDPAFSGVRQSIDSERKALAATHPAALTGDLATLAQLRTTLSSLPPRPLDAAPSATPHGFWQRTWQVLSHVVSVSHDNGAPISQADTHLARELAALDVAQAEAALLAHDPAAMHAALTRVDAALANDFDSRAPAVQQTRAEVARLQSRDMGTPAPKLGAALTELRNLRRVRDAGEPAAGATTSATALPAHSGNGEGGSPR